MSSSKLGTVLTLECNLLQRELWGDSLDFMYVHEPDHARTDHVDDMRPGDSISRASSVTTAADAAPSIADLARVHDIVLDCMAFYTARFSSANLLNPRFSSVLTSAEDILRQHVEDFVMGLPPEVRHVPAFSHVEHMLRELGGSNTFFTRKLKRIGFSVVRLRRGRRVQPASLMSSVSVCLCVCVSVCLCVCVSLSVPVLSCLRTGASCPRTCSQRGCCSTNQHRSG